MRPNTERTYKERILRVLVYIQNHLDEAVSLESLAASLISPLITSIASSEVW